MTIVFSCPYLNDTVELTEEREQHITETHPGTLPIYQYQIAVTLADPTKFGVAAGMNGHVYLSNGLLAFGQVDIWLLSLLQMSIPCFIGLSQHTPLVN